jgi:Putative MetA-pathway of phenol degradation
MKKTKSHSHRPRPLAFTHRNAWAVLPATVIALALGANAEEHGKTAPAKKDSHAHGDSHGNSHGGPAVDYSQYNLFKPVPHDKLRRFRPDAPLRTQNPFTVDPGRFQIEMEAFEYVTDEQLGVEETERAIGHFNFKVGVLHNLDLQAIVPTYTHVEEKLTYQDPPIKETQTGFGDFTLRAKYNLWGNDHGPSALGVIPFVSFATSDQNLGSDETEFGLLLPFSYELPHHLELRAMTGLQTIPGVTGREYSFVNSLGLLGKIVDRVEGFAEFWSEFNTDEGTETQITLGGGLIYEVSHDFHVDAGMNFGVTEATPDFQTFLGLNFRF